MLHPGEILAREENEVNGAASWEMDQWQSQNNA